MLTKNGPIKPSMRPMRPLMSKSGNSFWKPYSGYDVLKGVLTLTYKTSCHGPPKRPLGEGRQA